MACVCGLFAVERRGNLGQRTRHQRQTVVLLATTQPCLQRRSDVNLDVVVLRTGGNRNPKRNAWPQRWRVRIGNVVLVPCAVYEEHVKVAGRGQARDEELERRLIQLAGVDAAREWRKIELYKSRAAAAGL